MLNKYNYLIPTIEYFVERKCWPSWKIDKDEINFYDLTYIISGEAVYIVDGEEFELEEGDFIYISRGSSRKACTISENPMHCYAVNFQYEYSEGDFFELPFPAQFNLNKNYDIIKLYQKLNVLWLEKNKEYLLEARALFMLLLKNIISQLSSSEEKKVHDKRIEKVKQYILNKYHQEIKVQELAELVNLNPVYFGTYFKKKTGVKVNRYINQIRINKAENLLSAGGYTVAETAYQCGFKDPFYFSKTFKKIKGFSPSDLLK
ncbi:MAG: helix-turn-helix domain-containing protein [Bacillota bacterium]